MSTCIDLKLILYLIICIFDNLIFDSLQNLKKLNYFTIFDYFRVCCLPELFSLICCLITSLLLDVTHAEQMALIAVLYL